MYCIYQDRDELENDLYQGDELDSEGSEANSDLEFRLYSQLHYSSNLGETEEQEDGEDKEHQDNLEQEVNGKAADGEEVLECTGESNPPSPINVHIHQQQQKKKKKGVKVDKKNKRKSDPKGQKPSSSCFEEVIVIDSSPDVISISEDDTADDDKGVCALKGGGFHRLHTSTPAQQENRKRNLVPVTLDSSSSESDSEDSGSRSSSPDLSESSDSDDLENWMILGRGNQAEDQSISLNLEGGSDTNEGAEEGGSWLVSDKDKEAQIFNKDRNAKITVQRLPNRYYTGKSVQCRNCNKMGHLSKNCPEPKKISPCFLCGTPGHLAIECPNKHCNNCGLPGHLYESCSERAYWHKQCHRCSMTGHFFDACPEIWRQYHITTKMGPPVNQQEADPARSPAYCYNCSRKGHFGHACNRQRMFRGVYPITPFINHYDTVEDINSRQHRLKMKVKELRKSGFLPTSPQTPLTPGPPKKKQKISHHKNNHHSNLTPHHTHNNHKPTHIRFNHNSFSAGTPKTKYNKCKPQESGSNVKPWKPKRPVPTSRGPLPPAKRILDEADDFPRGGGTGQSMREKKKRRRMSKMMQGFLSAPERPTPNHLSWKRQGGGSKQEKGEKKKKNKSNKHRIAEKQHGAQMYPTDENLFIIKQRKRSR